MLFVQNSSYHPFGRAFVFARSTRFGVELPTGDTTGNAPTNCSGTMTSGPIIPLPERFFSGGAQSLRGFSLNEAGPRDPCTGFPIGGLALLIFNQELRFPMKLPFIGNRLGGTVFYDGGNVYSDVNHINLNWKSASPTVSELFFAHDRIWRALCHSHRPGARGFWLPAESRAILGNAFTSHGAAHANLSHFAFRIFI